MGKFPPKMNNLPYFSFRKNIVSTAARTLNLGISNRPRLPLRHRELGRASAYEHGIQFAAFLMKNNHLGRDAIECIKI